MEEWRDVVGYEGLYVVSNSGVVMKNTGRIISQRHDKDGYCIVTLFKDKVRKDYKVHRLVAMAFIPNILNLPVINHKDENKSNNIVSNLEWCTPKYNSNYGTANQRKSEKQKGVPNPRCQGERNYFYGKHFSGGLSPSAKPVLQYSLDGNFIAEYDCIRSAAKITGAYDTAIGACCRGKRNKAKGYLWKYKNIV